MTLLGQISPQTFLETYWQQKPLVVQGALPNWPSPLTGDELAGLAMEPDVTSRLVRGAAGQDPWSVTFGPFEATDFCNAAGV